MANYYGSARSNYFKVKDAEAFKLWAATIPDIGVWEKDGLFGIYSDNSDGAGWPCWKWNEDESDQVDLDLLQELSDHLAHGEVAILMEAGAEKLRYVCGFANAVNSHGEVLFISLNDIYQKVTETWGVSPTFAEF